MSSLPAKVLCSLDISVPDVFAALVSLDPVKAKGIDHIGPMVLKSCAEALCSPIHHLFCVSLSTGKLPAEWRTLPFLSLVTNPQSKIIDRFPCCVPFLKF